MAGTTSIVYEDPRAKEFSASASKGDLTTPLPGCGRGSGGRCRSIGCRRRCPDGDRSHEDGTRHNGASRGNRADHSFCPRGPRTGGQRAVGARCRCRRLSPPRKIYTADSRKIIPPAEIFRCECSRYRVAVTVSRVSVVDRMVSKEYVQTARPYDRDLASPGAWIETGLSSRSPWWATVTASFVTGTGICARRILNCKKKYACAHVGACLR